MWRRRLEPLSKYHRKMEEKEGSWSRAMSEGFPWFLYWGSRLVVSPKSGRRFSKLRFKSIWLWKFHVHIIKINYVLVFMCVCQLFCVYHPMFDLTCVVRFLYFYLLCAGAGYGKDWCVMCDVRMAYELLRKFSMNELLQLEVHHAFHERLDFGHALAEVRFHFRHLLDAFLLPMKRE